MGEGRGRVISKRLEMDGDEASLAARLMLGLLGCGARDGGREGNKIFRNLSHNVFKSTFSKTSYSVSFSQFSRKAD